MIDTPFSTFGLAAKIREAGHGGVIRYISPNTSRFKTKQLTLAEAKELSEHGIWVGGVFEKMGDLDEMSAAQGAAHAKAAVDHYHKLGVPQGNAGIFLAADFDPSDEEQQDAVFSYFEAAHPIIREGGYLSGGYVCGLVMDRLKDAGLIHYSWLPSAYSWTGSRRSLKMGHYDILQHPEKANVAGLDVDLNNLRRGAPDQFGLWKLH